MRAKIIYKDQTAVKLVLETDIDLEANVLAGSGAKVAYRKPSGAEGTWPGSLLNSPGTDGKIFFDFTASDKFDELGDWVVWAELTFADNRVGYGKPKFYSVMKKGTTSN